MCGRAEVSWRVSVFFTEGPRVVVNTLTLVSVIRANLIPNHKEEALSAIGWFFENVGHVYDHKQVQSPILGTMTFTTITWLFTAIQLTIACVMYLCSPIRVIEKMSLKDYCRKSGQEDDENSTRKSQAGPSERRFTAANTPDNSPAELHNGQQ